MGPACVYRELPTFPFVPGRERCLVSGTVRKRGRGREAGCQPDEHQVLPFSSQTSGRLAENSFLTLKSKRKVDRSRVCLYGSELRGTDRDSIYLLFCISPQIEAVDLNSQVSENSKQQGVSFPASKASRQSYAVIRPSKGPY